MLCGRRMCVRLPVRLEWMEQKDRWMECVRADALTPRDVTSRNTLRSFGRPRTMAERIAPGQRLNVGRYCLAHEINRKTNGVHCAQTLLKGAGETTAVVYEAQDSAKGNGRAQDHIVQSRR